MARLSGEAKVYSEFLTNLAVAWFSAGIIAPFFTPAIGIFRFSGSPLAIIACLISLKLAVFFTEEGR